MLNGTATVAGPTRKRIASAIDALGYSPNAAARALTVGRSRTIAAVIPTLAHSIFATFLNAVESRLLERQYGLVIATTGESEAAELARVRSLLQMGVDGLILSGISHATNLQNVLESFDRPAVLTSIFDLAAPFPTIGYDNEGLARSAARHLLDHGHRRIAVLHGPKAHNDRTRARIAGAVAEIGAIDARLIETGLSETGGVKALRRAFESDQPPTALLCFSDVIALGAMFELRRLSMAVPDQVSVIGFDDLPWAEHSDPPLTSVALPTYEMGLAAADALTDWLDHGTAVKPVLLPGRLVVRGSTGPTP